MTSRLAESIQSLYKIFEKYHPNSNMSGSSNYDALKLWNEELFSKPLAKLNDDDLSRYAGKAITTWGEPNDYKHFLPRIFELTAIYRTPYEIWISFDKLERAGWLSWPQEEQGVICEFMLSLWENLINDESEAAAWVFQDYFSALANFYPEFDDLLEIWSRSVSKSAISYLANLVINEQTKLFDRQKISGFHDKTENAEHLISWLISDTILMKVQESFFIFDDAALAQKISWADQIISYQQKNYNLAPVQGDQL
ncbi:hypothetical protein [Robertkochia solimangrovi]|uniref:hypothetical protein n=1 Tax=Robertkochia solimangrovi TaxID=2213046 RepID=UPI00117C02CB|nr:hypothetical protein [Robertkochia solimangrovi]TRZ41619.1 hypothetical protein DMZ48_16555 [Robertkochia solimangrovi]